MTKKQKTTLYRVIAAVVLLLVVSLLCELVPGVPGWAQLVLYAVPYLTIGYDILIKAAKGVKNRQPFDECFLMAVATLGAILLGEYREGVAVMLFYQIGELFQSIAVGKSRRSITELMDIRPDSANLELEDGSFEETDPDDVAVGSVIVVQPGERVPIDGDVIEGTSSLNTAALTGESLPREVTVGDSIISGCINMTGVLRVRTTKEFGESTVSKILDLVENSSMKKARMENFITRFARYYTPAVCFGALALAIFPPLISLLLGGEAGWSTWVYRALSFLVVSCPCALVISIPLSFFGGIGGASTKGVLVKGSNYLEALAETDCVVFDKTGTLTQGVFQVTEVQPAPGIDQQKLLEVAALAERYSNHPISRSLKEAVGVDLSAGRVEDVAEISGHGVTATVEGQSVAVGNGRMMERVGVTYTPCTTPGTILYVACDGAYWGYILISDVVKPHAKEAITQLKAAGVTKTVMLTGDNAAVAQVVAEELGVDQVYAGLLPGDKVTKVEELLAAEGKDKKLAFVGDGINDAPVLSRADVGIAMGALGSDAAIEAADIVLMDDDPQKIALAMAIARKTLRIVRENIVLALGVKAVCLILVAVGLANMWAAVFADVGVMVLAVLNAMRALRA